MTIIKTSLYIHEELLKQLRIFCAVHDWTGRRGKSQNDFIVLAIAEKMDRDATGKKEGE